MTTPNRSSFRGWWNARPSGTLALYYGSGAAGAPAEVQRVDANGTTIVTGDLALADGTVYLYNGGTVTQATNKSTGVELNTDSGQITMNGAALGDDTEISFVVTNSNVAATDVVIVNHASAGTMGAYVVQASAIGAGSFEISVKNVSGGSLSQAIVINFGLIKGASS